MKRFYLVASIALALGLVASSASAGTIAQWDFSSAGTGLQSPAYPSSSSNYELPATTDNTDMNNNLGEAAAAPLGMLNNYDYTSGGSTVAVGSVPWCDVLNTAGLTGSGASNYTANAWRIRGPSTNGYKPTSGTPTGTGNGWSNQAPQYTQGAEFDADTTGYSTVAVAFNYYSTTQGVKNMEIQYNTDTNNSNGWTNLEALVSVSNDWYGSSANAIVVNMPASCADDANFGVRMVSAYDTDPAFVALYGNTYAAATSTSSAPALYNNSSGNWRFGTVTIETAASVPEPSTILLLAAGGIAAAFLSLRRARRAVR